MKKYLQWSIGVAFLFLCLIAIAGNRNIHKNALKNKLETATAMDTTKIAIIHYNYTAHFWVFKEGTSAILTTEQLNTIESLLKKAVDNYNAEREQYYKNINYEYPKEKYRIELLDYKRQYIAVANENSETEVWINCFCEMHNADWKKEIVAVSDGGKCYFNLKINLSANSYHNFMVNGEA